MINGNPNEFIDRIYTCQDTVFVYRGVKYWFQGYMPDDSTVHMEVFQVDPEKDGYIWEYDGKTIEECYAMGYGVFDDWFIEIPHTDFSGYDLEKTPETPAEINGGLIQNTETGEYYVITARNSNLFRIF